MAETTNVKTELVPQAPTQIVDPKAKAFTDKLMELITATYDLSTELATIEDPQLLNSSLAKAARKVVQKVKELREVIGGK